MAADRYQQRKLLQIAARGVIVPSKGSFPLLTSSPLSLPPSLPPPSPFPLSRPLERADWGLRFPAFLTRFLVSSTEVVQSGYPWRARLCVPDCFWERVAQTRVIHWLVTFHEIFEFLASSMSLGETVFLQWSPRLRRAGQKVRLFCEKLGSGRKRIVDVLVFTFENLPIVVLVFTVEWLAK